jgi:predicted nucleic acid-binding protein
LPSKLLVLDANILIRAVLGKKVRQFIVDHKGLIQFISPEVAYDDATIYLPDLLARRGVAPVLAHEILTQLRTLVAPIPEEIYISKQPIALARIAARDADDWPILACALKFNCGIWTEDQDFFGTGVPTWTSDLVHLY